MRKSIPAISIDWLVDSAAQNKILDETGYLYKQPDNGAQTEGKKRKKADPEKDAEVSRDKPIKGQKGKETEPEPSVRKTL